MAIETSVRVYVNCERGEVSVTGSTMAKVKKELEVIDIDPAKALGEPRSAHIHAGPESIANQTATELGAAPTPEGPAPVPEPETDDNPEPEEEKQPEITLAELRAKIAELMELGAPGSKFTVDLIQSYPEARDEKGLPKVDKLDPKNFADAMAKANAFLSENASSGGGVL